MRQLAFIGLIGALVFVFSWMQIPSAMWRAFIWEMCSARCRVCCLIRLWAVYRGLAVCCSILQIPCILRKLDYVFNEIFYRFFGEGWIAHKGTLSLKKDIIGAAVGSVTYVVLYLAKSFIIKFFIEGQAFGAVAASILVTKAVTSLINAVLAVIVSVLVKRCPFAPRIFE